MGNRSAETLRQISEARLVVLMTPGDAHGDGGVSLREWIVALDDDELVEMLATESFAAGHKAGEVFFKHSHSLKLDWVPCKDPCEVEFCVAARAHAASVRAK